MTVVLGLDISTTYTGVALLEMYCDHCDGEGWLWRRELPDTSDWDGSADDTRYTCPYCDRDSVHFEMGTLNQLELVHIDFKKCNTVWDKADRVATWFDQKLASGAKGWKNIEGIYIEDPAKKFSQGQSSASTIVTLARFNGLVSYIARNKFKLDPIYLAPGAARKACGLKMQQKKKCGKTHKQQTFDAMMATDLAHITWPLKMRSTNIVDWAYDIVDAYVIAKAGLNTR